LKVAPDEVREDKGAEVANVREVVHRRPAAVHADLFARRIEWREFLPRAGQRIEKLQTHVANGRLE
jgi:hypothetical protein